MRHFVKKASPPAFETWKAQANEDWSPSYATMGSERKGALLKALLEEQAYVCCYCGRSVDEQGSHVEHFRPQEQFPQLALDYANLHASCIRTPKGARAAWHCGHAKQNQFCEERFISPNDATCEQRFLYAMNGEMLVADQLDQRATYMHGLLRMNAPALSEWRNAALERVFDDDFVASATSQELVELVDAFRRPAPDGRCRDFGHVIARHAQQVLERLKPAPLPAAA